MACGCESYQCVEIPVNPCNTGTGIGVTAELTCNYTIRLFFNGYTYIVGVMADAGDELSVPTYVLNEQYTHEIRVIDPNGTTTCYYGETHPEFTAAGYTPIPPANDTWQWGELEVNGMTVSDVLLSGQISPIIWINQNPTDWQEVGITHVGDTLDFTSIGGVQGTIIFQYKGITV